MTTVFRPGSYGIFIEIQNNLRRNKFHRANKDSNFLGGSFGNRDNEEPQSNLEEKDNPSILEDDFSSRKDPSIFTSIAPALWPVKWNQLSFSNVEINKPLLATVQNFLVDKIQVQKPVLVAATDQMPGHT